MRQFTKSVVKELDIAAGATRVALVTYGDYARFRFALNRFRYDRRALEWALETVPYYSGSTNTADALKLTRHLVFNEHAGDRPEAENVIILVTDGMSNINTERTIPEAKKLHKEGVYIYVVGIGLVNNTEVDSLVSESTALFEPQDFNGLENTAQELIRNLCELTGKKKKKRKPGRRFDFTGRNKRKP